MAISFNKYVDITSAVAATTLSQQRELIGRIFTTNNLVPTGSFVEFTDSDSVGSYFGTSSEEYKRAVYYFSFISKNVTSPNKISYGRWVNVNVAPMIFGKKVTATVAQFQAITDGSFVLTIGPDTHQLNGLTGIDFSSVTSLSDVASAIQTSINAETGTMWTAATFTYNSSQNRFEFVGGSAVDATISAQVPLFITNILSMIGFDNGAIFSNGSLAESITDCLINSSNASNNFGSFLFMPTLTLSQQTEAAIFVDSLDVVYQFYTEVSLSDYITNSNALKIYSGVGMTIASPPTTFLTPEFPEQLPMNIMAATDYSAQNSVQNYMYQTSSLTPSVTDTTLSNDLDSKRVNYYGRTQQAGKFIDFYQRGVLFGNVDDPLDMNTFANEQWLKDAAGAQIMALFLALSEIPANVKGRLILLNGLQSIINQALFNGVISVGKTLNTTQRLFISQISGDKNAWYQVQNIGYWVDCRILLVGLEYQATYILIYSKDDAIRKVQGSHILV